ncbi:hypothetical protein GH714_023003 [Hevea brasiliensis]|uniref:DUF1421 domain-containing protein n=1 Tax=Hevea brasiliensis TaxID=3981 RepID=A0A6A6MHF2_HEVBR|nr:hypothetical protein GH714_023003 [Hevea brasiliensis]
MMNSGGAIQSLEVDEDGSWVRIGVKGSGEMKMFASERPKTCKIDGVEVEFCYTVKIQVPWHGSPGLSVIDGSSTMKPIQPSPSPPVSTGENSYSQLLFPTASSVDCGSCFGGGGNRVPVDHVITMGFRRESVRAIVKKLMENGQSVDLNIGLDKLMSSG